MPWKGIVGDSFNKDSFDQYCHTLTWTAWRPSFVVLHNTGAPSLEQRPDGLNKQHINQMEIYYRDDRKWSAGPHLIIDDHQIWVFTPLTVSGVHCPSWNKVSLGIQMLGDYDREAFDSGRGLAVRKNTVAAIVTLNAILGFEPDTLRLHKEDPLCEHFCPGKNVIKTEIINEVKDLMMVRHGGEHVV